MVGVGRPENDSHAWHPPDPDQTHRGIEPRVLHAFCDLLSACSMRMEIAHSLVGARKKFGGAVARLDFVELPHHARQSCVNLALLHVVHVARSREVEEARASVRAPVVVPGGAVRRVGVVKPEAVALLRRQPLMAQDLVQHAHHSRMVQQHLAGSALQSAAATRVGSGQCGG